MPCLVPKQPPLCTMPTIDLRAVSDAVVSQLQLSYNSTEISDGLKCYMIPYGHVAFAAHMITYITLGFLIGVLQVLRWKGAVALTLPFLFKLAVAIYTTTQCDGTYRLLAIWQLLLSCFYGPFGIAIFMGQYVVAGILMCLFFIPGVVIGILGLIPLIRHNQESLHHVSRVFLILSGIIAGYAALYVLIAFMVFATLAIHSIVSAKHARRAEEETIANWEQQASKAMERLEKFGSLLPQNTTPTANRRGLTKASLKLASLLGWGTTRTSRTSVSHIKQFFVAFATVLGCLSLILYILGTLYSDWVLGIVSDNLLGVGHTTKSKGLAAGWFLASIMVPL